MSPKDDAENWRTAMRLGKWLKQNPLLIGVIAYALGGGSGTVIEKFIPEKQSPQMDTIMIAVRQIPGMADTLVSHQKAIQGLQADVGEVDYRLAMVEPDNSRSRYLPRRVRGIGRHRE